MKNRPLINKKLIRKNAQTKSALKRAKHYYKTGHGAPLRNLLFKVVKTAVPESEFLCPEAANHQDYENPNLDVLLAKIKETALTGMSGNGFPVFQKLLSFIEHTKSVSETTLLVNAVECDPGLVHDEWLVNTQFESICRGISVIQHSLGIRHTVLVKKAVHDVKPGTMTVDKYSGLKTFHIPVRYPYGEEHFMIQAVLGRSIPKSELPVQHGILVMNVQTVWQIDRILSGSYDGGHYISVANIEQGISKPVYVANNTEILPLLQQIYPHKTPGQYNYYAGSGIMSAHKISNHETFDDSTSFAASLPVQFETTLSNENRCKGCGACSHRCPTGIDVKKIVSLKEKDAHADISMLHPETCIHCGSCTWYCHGNKIPEQYMNKE